MLRPSGAPRWVPCPPSARLEAPFPEDDGEDAKEGTAAHWAAAEVLSGRVSCIEELTDRTAPNGIIINGDMVDAANLYIATVPPGSIIEREVPSYIPGVEPGTPDALRVNGRHGDIWDFKYGWRIVEPWSWQLATYVVFLFLIYKWELDDITVHVVQPRPFHPDGRVRSKVIARNEAITLHSHIATAAQRANDPAALCQTGVHCHDCRALHVCEAARRAALNAVDVTFAATPIDLPPAEMSAELKMLNRAADMIKLRLAAMESNTMAVIDKGVVVPGWSIDRAYGRNRWIDDNVMVIETLTGIQLTESKPVTPAEAKRRGVPPELVKQFTTTPVTGRKLIERDSSAKAKEVFK